MLTLYLVTDRAMARDRPLDDVVNEAVAGGVTCVQLREKHSSTREFLQQAERVRRVLDGSGVPLIVNDRVDVALAVGADGVHLGQHDMPYPTARALLGPDAVIGLSVETVADVEQANDWDVDYLGVSPIFETATKRDTRGSWGLDGLARVRAMTRHPLVAIGGINWRNVADVVRSGADGIAVVSAISAAADPRRAAEDLRQRIDRVNPHLTEHST
jgi:thiamine-phosphate pyrophosphorylase